MDNINIKEKNKKSVVPYNDLPNIQKGVNETLKKQFESDEKNIEEENETNVESFIDLENYEKDTKSDPIDELNKIEDNLNKAKEKAKEENNGEILNKIKNIKKIWKKIFFISTEMIQNTYHYSFPNTPKKFELKQITLGDKKYMKIYTKNSFEDKNNKKKDKLDSIIEEVNNLNEEGLKEKTSKILPNGEYNEKGQAGLGFYQMAKKIKSLKADNVFEKKIEDLEEGLKTLKLYAYIPIEEYLEIQEIEEYLQ